MNGTRWTTLFSRFLIGLSGGFLLHGSSDNFKPFGILFFFITLVLGVIVFLCLEEQTPKTKKEKSKGDSIAVFGQWQTIAVCIAAIVGGAMRWLI